MEIKLNSVMLVDDHALIIDAVRGILKKNPRIGSVQAFTSGRMAAEAAESNDFDLYLLDLELVDMNGYDLIKHILAHHPGASIIVNTMHEEIWTVNHLMELGVSGIVLKSSPTECLEKAVGEVLDGNEYLCPRFDYLRQKAASSRSKEYTMPTRRELDVLKLIVKGATTDEISERLHISINTVETFRKNLMVKLGAKNVAHLTALAIQKRLIEPF